MPSGGLLHLVGYLYYWQMGFNSVFKGLNLPYAPIWTPTYRTELWCLLNVFVLLHVTSIFASSRKTTQSKHHNSLM